MGRMAKNICGYTLKLPQRHVHLTLAFEENVFGGNHNKLVGGETG